MTTELIESADELGIRISDEIVKTLHLAPDDEVDVEYDEKTGLLELRIERSEANA